MSRAFISGSKLKTHLNQYVFFMESNCLFYTKVNQTVKRGSLLSEMVKDRDRKKNWHFNIMADVPQTNRKNVFEKVYKPSRRQNVLNSLFIKNVTDVLSTGDIAPEILGHGIEITGVKISPCCKILNIYWQVPPYNFSSCEDLALLLNERAPAIRSELISRNVLGRVPKIYFIRDHTNAKSAAFEEALKKADVGPERDMSIIPDDVFTKNIYSFKVPQNKEEDKKDEILLENFNKDSNMPPPKPPDMRSDIFGIDRETMMSRVVAMKKKTKSTQPSAVISHECLESGDLFNKIPGTSLHDDSDREKLLKQFNIERKILMQKRNHYEEETEGSLTYNDTYEEFGPNKRIEEEDYIEEDTTEKF